MLKDLPTFIEPKQLALETSNLKGKVALAQMTRLHESLCDVQGDAQIDWLFTMDEKGRPTIQGDVQAQLLIPCQRCLQPMQWFCNAKVALIILINGQNEELPASYEAVTLTSTPVSLIRLVEDELILALPIVTMHNKCPSNEYQLAESFLENDTYQNNPFSVLSEIKKMKMGNGEN